MRALVVYESMFGNTQLVARAIAQGLSTRLHVDVVEVGAAPERLGDDVGLLVVGAPTHAFGMSRPGTRQDAARQADRLIVSQGYGLREWLAGLPSGSETVAAAAFDTHVDKPRVPGSAARAAHKRLRRLGLRVVAPAESFYVTGTAGPLLDGETERARLWGEALAAEVTGSAAPRQVS